jgi:electron transfer flavoprotein beta subunit
MKDFKTVVCVRPVLDVRRTAPELDPDGHIRRELLNVVINEADLIALEAALRIRESAGGRVLVLCNGNQSAIEQLRLGLAMGADEAILIPESEPHQEDSLIVAARLTKALNEIEADLILCGESSIEGMHGIVGPGVAHLLRIPAITGVVKLDVSHITMRVRATQRLDWGGRLVWECQLPILCTVDSTMHTPRYTPVHRIVMSHQRQVRSILLDGVEELTEQVRKRFGGVRYAGLSYPRIRPKKTASLPKSMSPSERLKAVRSVGTLKKDKGERLRGDPAHVAAKLLEFLVEKGFV